MRYYVKNETGSRPTIVKLDDKAAKAAKLGDGFETARAAQDSLDNSSGRKGRRSPSNKARGAGGDKVTGTQGQGTPDPDLSTQNPAGGQEPPAGDGGDKK